MTPRERLLTTLNHEEPDRVPIEVWNTPEIEEKLYAHFGPALTDGLPGGLPACVRNTLAFDHAFIQVACGPVEGFYMKPDDSYHDEWGVKWSWVDNGSGGRYTEIVGHPYADCEDISKIKIPDYKDPLRYEEFAWIKENYGKDHAIMAGLPCTLFELSWYLRGMENVMMEMIEDEEFYDALLDHLMAWVYDAGTNMVQRGADIVFIGDDFGGQDNMLMSPQLFRRYFKPRYARLFEHLRKINPNIYFAFHSDGNILPIIDDLIEIGVQILNPVQPKSMDPSDLKKKYGDKLTFWQAVENQEVIPFGTPEDIVEEVKLRLETLAPGGGYIMGPSHGVQANVPLENILAFYQAAKMYGSYPIQFQ